MMNDHIKSLAQLDWEDHLGHVSFQVKKNRIKSKDQKNSLKQALIEKRRDNFVKWVELRKFTGMGDE